ncbi:MAG: TIGR02757 family protein [Bacteroidota bacterium]
MTETQALKDLLEDRYQRYNQPNFIESDPIWIPHQYSKKEDIEISGFLTALIAWGRRSSILTNALSLMERMDHAPHDFVLHSTWEDRERLNGFVHRTFNLEDCLALMDSLAGVYQHHGGLENIFSQGIQKGDTDVKGGILNARELLLSPPNFPKRTHKHVANPNQGSAAKRINMFLRWMVRRDKRGVDFGIWPEITPSQLICPLDVHTGNVARKLGLLTRKQNDWKAALELTESLRSFCPEDPVKYDFSLFGLGVFEGW